MDDNWLDGLMACPELLGMGHAQRAEDRNLGLGWLYYALTRAFRPRMAVCIGSWRGFVPLMLGRGMKDNTEGGQVVFIDPSFVDDFWADPDRTRVWFAGFGLDNIQHHRVTTQEFAVSEHFVSMSGVDLLFVDGYHTAEQARFDHEAFEPLLTKNAIVLFHDSVRWKQSHIYGQDRPYEHTVLYYMDELKKRPNLQVMDIPLDSGVTIVRRIG